MDSDESEFDKLADSIEGYLGQYGMAYRRGEGDFSLNHDYYGNKELGVIILRPIFNELLLHQFMLSIQKLSPGWEIWVTFETGAEWCEQHQITINSDGWRPAECRN
ncbi:MAG: hypothetical protein AB1899_11940 [Pseudomonadota bacterium]